MQARGRWISSIDRERASSATGTPMTPQPARPARLSHEMRVLVVESDRISRDNLRDRISSWGFQASVAEENQWRRRKLIEAGTLGPIVGQSLVIRRVMRQIDEAASSTAPVLIVG